MTCIFSACAQEISEATPEQDLFERLQGLENRIEALQERAEDEEVYSATESPGDLLEFLEPGRRTFGGWFRTGIDHNVYTSRGVVSRVSENAEDSLRRLDELLAEVETIVNDNPSEEAESLLEQARFFRNEAEANLDAGNDDDALRDMSVSESLALQAAEVAGSPVSDENTDRETDGYVELGLRWNLDSDRNSLHRLTLRTREGDEYFEQRFDWDLRRNIGERTELTIDNTARIREYQDSFIDDYFEDRLFVRWRWKPDNRWAVDLEGYGTIRTEYRSSPDEGYWTQEPGVRVSYTWDAFRRIDFSYHYSARRYLSDEQSEFDSDRHRLRQSLDLLSANWQALVSLEQSWRDYNKPEDEDDYFELLADSRLARRLSAWCSLGLETEYEGRRYQLKGDSSTNYDQIGLEPFVEVEWTSQLRQILLYRWQGRTHDDDDPADGIEKDIGDFNDHRLALETWWEPFSYLRTSLNGEIDWRRYRHGQTGEYELYLPDFRPVSNFQRYSISSFTELQIASKSRLFATVYWAEERHDRYPIHDVDELSANLEWRVEF